MIGPLPTAPGGFNRVLVAIDKFTKWIEVKPVTCPKADKVLDFLDELVHRYGLPHRIITDLAPTSTTTSSGSTARTAGSTSDMSQLPILGPMDKSSAPMGWCSTPSKSGYTTPPTPKRQVDQGTTQCYLGATYSTLQANGAIPILPSLQLRSNPSC
jgi:hypothetical protein